MRVCDYGCGKEAKFYFSTTKKWRCSYSYRVCNGKKANKPLSKVDQERVIKNSDFLKELDGSCINLCDLSLGRSREILKTCQKCLEVSKVRLADYLLCLTEFCNSCSKTEERNVSKKVDVRSKISKKLKGKKKPVRTEEHRRRQSEAMKGDKNPSKRFELREKRRQYMKVNGNRIRKSKKNPSRAELNLRSLIKDLFPTSVHTFKVLPNKDYDVDVALPKYKIVIEYDGWYHFNIPGKREYDKKRQEEIEKDGWKFVRYTMFDKFPTKEKIKEDIEKILSGVEK